MTEDHRELIFPSSISSDATGLAAPILPPPGPNSRWTAGGVIKALEPLTTASRRERLREVLLRRTKSVTLVMDDAHKAHNRAAVVRSCEAFGVQRAHFLNPEGSEENLALSKLVSKGCHHWMDIIEHSTPSSVIHELQKSGHQLLVTHPQGQLVPEDLKDIPKVALIMGNEKFGVGDELTQAADNTISIPMTGFVESLNVSVTAAILLRAATIGREPDLSPEETENIYARWLRNSVPRADEVLNSFSPC